MHLYHRLARTRIRSVSELASPFSRAGPGRRKGIHTANAAGPNLLGDISTLPPITRIRCRIDASTIAGSSDCSFASGAPSSENLIQKLWGSARTGGAVGFIV